ncbi:MAG: glycosyltransferase [Candidatus Aenigmarchaeota archaeon]|nr:glycosyltransferase [Candidatus Aenigmarchaeota archaeon]
MKIAILHDYFDKKGGGERLILNLARALKADVYTGFVDYKKTFSTRGLKIKSLGVKKWLPVILRNYSIAKKFERYKFPKYDAFIISGFWSVSASGNHPSILYCHTPPRFMYDLRKYFLKNANPILRPILKMFIKYWKPKDQFYMKQFNKICPNSENVRKRVLKYYGKKLYEKCEVVYTGIETKKFYYKKEEGFYLSTARLDPLKRIDLIINAFRQMPSRKLFITGAGPEKTRLQKIAKGYENISFLGDVSEQKLLDLYARCNAVIVAAKDEDLGLSAIEAQAAGKPVVAVKEGGFTETVNTKTGIYFKANANSLIKAIEKTEKTKWNRKELQKNAGRFDINIFIKKIRKIINDVIYE